MPDRDWWSILWPNPEAVLISLGARSGMVALDLCCGDGFFTVPLARIVQNDVYGVDIDSDLLKRAVAELKRSRLPARHMVCADAFDIVRLLPSKADYVLLANTFHGVSAKPELARIIARVLNPGGLLAIVNWHKLRRIDTKVLCLPRGPKTETRMSPEDVQLAVEPAGFVLTEVVDLPPFHYGAVFCLAERPSQSHS